MKRQQQYRRVSYPVRTYYVETGGARCIKCGGRAPKRACRRCGRLPRLLQVEGGFHREIGR